MQLIKRLAMEYNQEVNGIVHDSVELGGFYGIYYGVEKNSRT